MDNFNLSQFLMVIFALFLGITVHEFSHAIAADRLGDPTPRSQGRVTLSPLAHLDPIGTVFMIVSAVIGFGIGWGRPVMTNPDNYRINRRLGDSLVSFAGPLSNLVIAFLFAMLIRARVFPPTDAFFALCIVIVIINVYLFFFNLLPIFPLDGSHLLANAMPPEMAQAYYRFMMQFGTFIFLALIFTRILGRVIGPPADFIIGLLLGTNFGS